MWKKWRDVLDRGVMQRGSANPIQIGGDLFMVFRNTCRRLAALNGGVRAFVYASEGVLTVNVLSVDALQPERIEDYRLVHPDWLMTVDNKACICLTDQSEDARTTPEMKVFLNGHGAWEDEGCTIPFFRRSAGKGTLRDAAIAKLGEGRVAESEGVIRDTVSQLLAMPALKKAGFSWHRGVVPEITFRWKAGTSRGGRRGLSFAMMRHAMKPVHGAIFKEYARLNDYPCIGDFTGSRTQCLRVLAAHELAHWLQYEPKVKRPEWDFRAMHGEGFRRTYRILREALSELGGE